MIRGHEDRDVVEVRLPALVVAEAELLAAESALGLDVLRADQRVATALPHAVLDGANPEVHFPLRIVIDLSNRDHQAVSGGRSVVVGFLIFELDEALWGRRLEVVSAADQGQGCQS